MAHIFNGTLTLACIWLASCASNPTLDALIDINLSISATQPRDCQEHANRVIAHYANDDQYQAQPIYSCPDEQQAREGICHVSALITAPDNSRWVLDNGAVLGNDTIAVAGVSELDDFLWALGDKPHWIGPTAMTGMGLYIASVSLQH